MESIEKTNAAPKYMISKTLADGSLSYFWNPPLIYRGSANGPRPEALGKDLNAAVARATTLYNALAEWKSSTPAETRKAVAKRRQTLRHGKPAKHYARGYVYLVETEDFVKVGFTRNLVSRLAQINTCTPHSVRLIHSFPGTIRDEQEIHTHLGDHRHKLEWFRKTEEVMGYIDRLASVHAKSA